MKSGLQDMFKSLVIASVWASGPSWQPAYLNMIAVRMLPPLKVAVLLLFCLLFTAESLSAQEVDNSRTLEQLEQRQNAVSNRRYQIEKLLANTDYLMVLFDLQNTSQPGSSIEVIQSFSQDKIKAMIGIAVLDYCISKQVELDSKQALEYGKNMFNAVVSKDRRHRKKYQELLTSVIREENRIASLIKDRMAENRSSAPELAATDDELTGTWRFSTRNEIQFRRTGKNSWQGNYTKIGDDYYRRLGFSVGEISYRNVQLDSKTGVYSAEINWKSSGGKNQKWREAKFKINDGKLKQINGGLRAEKIND